MPFQPGNKLAKGGRKEKPFRDALRQELAAAGEDQKALRAIARGLIAKATEGDIVAVKEIADRMDGKVPQALIGDDQEDPVSVRTIVTGVPRAGDS